MNERNERKTHGVGFDGEDRVTVRETAELVLSSLLVEDLEARHRNDSNLDSLLREEFDGFDDNRDFGSGRDDREIGLLARVVENVTSLVGELDRRTDELRKVLSRETAASRGQMLRDEGGGETYAIMEGVRLQVMAM